MEYTDGFRSNTRVKIDFLLFSSRNYCPLLHPQSLPMEFNLLERHDPVVHKSPLHLQTLHLLWSKSVIFTNTCMHIASYQFQRTFSNTHIQKSSNDHALTFVKRTYGNWVIFCRPVSLDSSITKANGDDFIESTGAA